MNRKDNHLPEEWIQERLTAVGNGVKCMNESLITQQLKQTKEEILSHINHSTLIKYTGSPVIDEDRLFFTLLPFFNEEDWTDTHQTSAIAVSLIFAALAAHDLVKEKNATSKEQQLQVLAGDYYSGKYYQLLAITNQIELIQLLSDGVAAITEHKTRFYDLQKYSFEELIHSVQLIESNPIEQFMEHYSFHEYVFIAKEALLVIALKRELEAFENQQISFYLTNSYELQSNIELLRIEIETVEKNLLQDIRNSELLKENVKNAIFERVSERELNRS